MRMASTAAAAAAAAEDLHRYAVPKVDAPTLAVVGSDKRFPVRRVYCVGSNYRCAYAFVIFKLRFGRSACSPTLFGRSWGWVLLL